MSYDALNNSSRSQTGTGSLPGDLLALLLMIIGGVVFVVWFMTQPDLDRAVMINRSLNVLTLLLAQPGIFLTVKIVSGELDMRKKITFGMISMFGLAFVLPSAISAWLYPILLP